MTINDLPLNEHCEAARLLANRLPMLMRDGHVAELQKVIDEILAATYKAGYRLNDLRFTQCK